ncbi:tetraacyldisaccharide 4'-kinase [Capnocytophaga leadbetteri]|uniref:tetraacyldisaccharide 4'-kinase n=1 Tax=Capnocytophaga leadbetteri TaxID=327575 RepID=UPI0026EF9ED2|nr:tetraacyldisaccharide 4'-kinase [Capnocytophaga leadbetteri]
MRYLSFLLFPFALLYGAIVRLRHWCYNTGIFKEHTFAVPTICVGNVAVGGTGKSPMVEYLVRQLHPKCRVAVLSRGYKRKMKGFVLADAQSTVADLGDEPFQFWRKFYKDIILAVCGDRVEGMRQLLQLPTPPTVVILDDAFQHRPVKATKNIVLTVYGQLFTDDWLLPVGRLRDVVSRVQQADIVVVTKCPPDLSAAERERIVVQLQKKTRPQTPIVFATIAYSEQVYSVAGESPLEVFIQQPFTLVTGIANPHPLLDFLKKKGADFQHITFPDHHHFTDKELQQLQGLRVLTTEKDYVRFEQSWDGLYYLPIEMQFCTKEDAVKFGTVFGAFTQK